MAEPETSTATTPGSTPPTTDHVALTITDTPNTTTSGAVTTLTGTISTTTTPPAATAATSTASPPNTSTFGTAVGFGSKFVKGSNGDEGGNPAPTNMKEYETDFLHRIVADAGRWAHSTVLVEVWVLNSDRTHLIRPKDAWWIDPYFHHCGENCSFCRLTDETRSDFMEALPLAPGVGLPGALWAEAQSSSSSGGGVGGGGNSSTRTSTTTSENKFANVIMPRHVRWRQIKPLADDPDQPWNPRLQFLAKECGLGWAAGVPFDLEGSGGGGGAMTSSGGGCKGLVIYMAREHADIDKLTSITNEQYLTRATLLIGSAVSLREPRHATVQVRRDDLMATIRRVRTKILTIRRMGLSLDHYIEQQEQQQQSGAGGKISSTGGAGSTSTSPETVTTPDVPQPNPIMVFVRQKIHATRMKFWGANVLAPPVFTWEQTIWTLICSFTTLVILTRIHARLVTEFGPTSGIILGPFGALMTLQYGLTAAPASQPRNAIVGQALALVIAQSIGQIDGMEIWLKQSVATSLAIATMVKLGVTHPPAGAGALLFAAGRFTWEQVAIMIMGNCVAILCATIFNNLNDKRQYPTFWGMRSIHTIIFGDPTKTKTDKSDVKKL